MDNNISFKANIVTKMQGRHGLMQKVGENFAQKTKNLPGELHIFKDNRNYPDAIIISYNKQKDYILHDYEDFFGNNLKESKDITSAKINDVTKSLINIYKALVADVKFDDFRDQISKQIASTKRALKENTFLLNKALQKQDNNGIETYSLLMQQNQKRIAALMQQYSVEKDKYNEKLIKMADKEPKLEVWSMVVSDDIETLH